MTSTWPKKDVGWAICLQASTAPVQMRKKTAACDTPREQRRQRGPSGLGIGGSTSINLAKQIVHRAHSGKRKAKSANRRDRRGWGSLTNVATRSATGRGIYAASAHDYWICSNETEIAGGSHAEAA